MFRYKVVQKGDSFFNTGENVKGNNKMDVLLQFILSECNVLCLENTQI